MKQPGDVMAANESDPMSPHNRDAKSRKPYTAPKIIFSELAHGSTEGPTPVPHKLHGSSPAEAHTDSTIGTS